LQKRFDRKIKQYEHLKKNSSDAAANAKSIFG
jgi:hypothetical protein